MHFCLLSLKIRTVPSGQETASGPNLVLADYVGSGNQKWLITGTGGGYSISAKSAGPELVMVGKSGVSLDPNHPKIRLQPKVDDSYRDEWRIIRHDATIVAIRTEEEGHDHDATFPEVKRYLGYMGYKSIKEITETDSIPSEQCILSVASSKIFYSRSHGSQTAILLNLDNLEMTRVNMLEDNFFANCKLVYFGACQTGLGREDANNLVNAVHAKGAQSVVGFEESVYCEETNIWSLKFFEMLDLGATIENAACVADEEIERVWEDEIRTDSWYIAGSKTNTIVE